MLEKLGKVYQRFQKRYKKLTPEQRKGTGVYVLRDGMELSSREVDALREEIPYWKL